ncbi:MAG: carbohydrate ABC transporter permease [Candidatus Scatosoma sp.]
METLKNTEMVNNVGQTEPPMKKKKKKKLNILSHTITVLGVLFVLVPTYIMIITSFTSDIEANNASFSWWPKMGVTVEGYVKAFTRKAAGNSLLGSFWNTMWMYFPSTAVGVFMSAMAAFAFAKLDFVLKKPMFSILMATLTLPNCIGFIASFLMFDQMGWINTPLPIMVPRMLGTIGIVFFLRQFFLGIPNEIIGAANMDGLGEIGVFFYIILPISMPALFSQFVLNFIGGYNDYLGPLLYLQNAKMYTLQISLAFFAEAYVQDWPMRMAGCVIAMVPLIMLYLVAQKYILKGVAISTGLKG